METMLINKQPEVTRYGSNSSTQYPVDTVERGVNPELTEDRVFLRGAHLKAGVSTKEFLVFLACVFFSIAFVVFLNQIQTFVVTFVLKNSDELGGLIGTFALWDEIFSLVFVCVWGLVSDLTGRRVVFSIGFSIIGISFFLYTLPKTAIPDLLIVRLLFALGSSACTSMLAAGLADIVGVKNGMTSGIVGMFSGLGAVFSIFLLVPLPNMIEKIAGTQEDAVKYTLYIVGAIALAWAALTALTYQKKSVVIETRQVGSLKQKVKGAFQDFPRAFFLFTTDIKVAMGYISGFVARGDTVILTLFITAWAVKYFIEIGECTMDGEIGVPDNNTAKRVCRKAYVLSMMLSGIAQVFALLGAPIIGLLLTRLRASTVLALSSLIGAIGYFGFGFAESPTSKLNILWVCMLGFGEIGTIVTSLSLLSAHGKVPPELRGAVSGIYSLFGAIGIIFCSRLGGHLFDLWRYGAPFILMGGFHALLFVLGIICFFSEKSQQQVESINDS